MGAVLIHPTLVAMVNEGTAFTVYGIPANLQNYSATIFPILLTVWIMSYVEKFFNKYLPKSLKFVFAPLLTIFVMFPVALLAAGPLGSYMGNILFSLINSIGNMGGIGACIALAIVAAIWDYVVIAGMHWMFITSAIAVVAAGGVDTMLSPSAVPAVFAVGGMCLGTILLLKEKEERSIVASYIVAQLVGGLIEPGLYGVGFRYKRPFIGMMIGGFCGGLYNGIVGTVAYSIVPVSSLIAVLGFAGGPTSNFVNGVISAVISFVVAAIATYFIGLEKKVNK